MRTAEGFFFVFFFWKGLPPTADPPITHTLTPQRIKYSGRTSSRTLNRGRKRAGNGKRRQMSDEWRWVIGSRGGGEGATVRRWIGAMDWTRWQMARERAGNPVRTCSPGLYRKDRDCETRWLPIWFDSRRFSVQSVNQVNQSVSQSVTHSISQSIMQSCLWARLSQSPSSK